MTHEWSQLVLVAVVVIGALFAGCGDEGVGTAGRTSSTPVQATSSVASSSKPAATTIVTIAPVITPVRESELPGTAVDLAPAAGAVLSVIGVRYDDVLHVRHAPGTDRDVVADLVPVAEDFVATGRARMLSQSIWWEVITADDTYGWVSARFTARRGPTFDATSEVIAKLGDPPSAETMAELGEIVAETFVSQDPEVVSVIVPVESPSVVDLGEVVYDVVGFADDSLRAIRVHAFGLPEEGNDGFTLKSVEATDMCDSVRGGAGVFAGSCP